MDEQTRVVLTEILRATRNAKFVDERAWEAAWERLYGRNPLPPFPARPFKPDKDSWHPLGRFFR
jgi:hypothetical protein